MPPAPQTVPYIEGWGLAAFAPAFFRMEVGAERHPTHTEGADPPAPVLRHLPTQGTLYALYTAPGEPDVADPTSWYLLLVDARVVQIRVERPASRWARVEAQQYPQAVLDALCQVER